MSAKDRRALPKTDSVKLAAKSWSLYVAECADGSYYTGISKDVEARIEAHNQGRGAKYTATRGPIRLLFQEPQKDYSAALRREYQIKSLSKPRKRLFVQGETLPRPKKKAKMSFQRKKRKKRRGRRGRAKR